MKTFGLSKNTIITAMISLMLTVYTIIMNALFGNMFSTQVAKQKAKIYIRDNYPHQNMDITDCGYTMKDSVYFVKVENNENEDAHFTVYYDSFGEFICETGE